jgi:hypothetical protein
VAFTNTGKRITVELPGWKPGSTWVFRAEKSGADDFAIENDSYESVLSEEDAATARHMADEGKDNWAFVASHIRRVTKAAPAHVTLAQMSVRWDGAEFALPDDYSEEDDAEGNPIIHPLAGQVPPCTLRWIPKQDGPLLEAVFARMTKEWAGRGDQANRFRQTSNSPVGKSKSQPRGRSRTG